jgi:hypothetical protein
MALTKISRGLLDTGVSDSSDATAITISSSEQVMIGTTDAGYADYGDSLTVADVDGGGGNAGMTIRSGTSSYGTFYFSDATGTAAGTYAGKIQYNHSTNSMVFGTNSSDKLTIDSSGNAIFTKSGGAYLQLKDASAVRGAINVGTSDGLVFTTGSSFAERMRINDAGDVLIGGTQEYNTLNGRGNLVVGSGSGNEGITIVTGTSNTGGINFADGTSGDAAYRGYIEYRHDLDAFVFGTSATERMRLDSSGNLCLGTNSAFSGSILSVTSRFSDTSGFTVKMFSANDAEQFSIRGDGALFVGTDGNSPYSNTTGDSANAVLLSNGVLARSTSSQRYKKDIADATWGLTEVKQLRPVTFKSNRTGEFASDKTHGGLIAEEVHALGLTEFVDYNDSNEPDALHYGNMVALLTKAIQEQQVIIDDLKARIETLEG